MEGLLLLNTTLKHHANRYKYIYTREKKTKTKPNPKQPTETVRSLGCAGREAESFKNWHSLQDQCRCSLTFSPCSPPSPTLPTSRQQLS